MPKYKCYLERTAKQQAEISVTAENEDEAKFIIHEMEDSDMEWDHIASYISSIDIEEDIC